MENNDNGNSGVGFLSGLVLGAFAGAILALVLTPQTGEETRDLIAGKAQEAKGKAMDLASDLKDLAGQLSEDLRRQADDLSRRSREAYESTSKRAEGALHAAKTAAKAKIDELQQG